MFSLINTCIIKIIPFLPKSLIKLFANRYVAGTTISEACDVVESLNSSGQSATLDILGEHTINIKPNTKVHTFYKNELIISERHRHRYSLLDEYKLILEKNDNIVISGYSDRESEILEVTNKRFFIGCQFHPEMKTRLNRSSPLFMGLIQSILN